MALRLDDIVDGMNLLRSALISLTLTTLVKKLMQLDELTLRACKTVQEMLSFLSDYKKDPTVMEKAIAVGHVGGRGRPYLPQTHSLACSVMRCLVANVAWLRIFDRMETVLDYCDDAAGVVRSVVMKNA